MAHLFISYSKIEIDFARSLKKLLENFNFVVWMDETALVPHERWWREIEDNIKSSAAFIVIMSPNSAESDWVEREILLAERIKKPIFPILHSGEYWARLANIQYEDMTAGIPSALPAGFHEGLRRYIPTDIPRSTAPPPLQAPSQAPPPQHKPFDVFKAMNDYVELFDDHKLHEAQALLQQIRASNKAPKSFRLETHEAELAAAFAARDPTMDAMKAKYERHREYSFMRRLATRSNPTGVWESLQEFWKTYPGYDPDNLARFAPPPSPPDSVMLALTAARTFAGTRNRDWTPITATFKNMPIPNMKFCLVPVGSFQMGSNDNVREKPIHPQKLDQPFWIAQTPVTNAQWQIAVKAGVVKAPAEVGDSLKWYNDAQMAHAPIVGVDWFAATTFAEWLGAPLLTEREWEYAARGVESWVYPWGDTWVPDNAVFGGNSGGRSSDVSTRPQGASWVGALHLSGNVWEWTSSLYEKYPYVLDVKHEDIVNITSNRVLRGGSWRDSNEVYLRAAYRNDGAPNLQGFGIGFRVGLAADSY